jgi:hypothetical protein
MQAVMIAFRGSDIYHRSVLIANWLRNFGGMKQDVEFDPLGHNCTAVRPTMFACQELC